MDYQDVINALYRSDKSSSFTQSESVDDLNERTVTGAFHNHANLTLDDRCISVNRHACFRYDLTTHAFEISNERVTIISSNNHFELDEAEAEALIKEIKKQERIDLRSLPDEVLIQNYATEKRSERQQLEITQAQFEAHLKTHEIRRTVAHQKINEDLYKIEQPETPNIITITQRIYKAGNLMCFVEHRGETLYGASILNTDTQKYLTLKDFDMRILVTIIEAAFKKQLNNDKAYTLQNYIGKVYGSQSAFAHEQGVMKQQVTKWLKEGFIVVNNTLCSQRRELNL